MFSVVFLSLCSLTFARKTNKWADLGCTSEGLLSPANVPELWPSQAMEIYEFVQADSTLAASACQGPQEHSSKASTFHLLWECYDDSQECMLPTLNAQGLKTLIAFHPESTVNIWSNTVSENDVKSRVGGENVKVMRYDDKLFSDMPENVVRAYETIPTFFKTVVESHSHFSDLFRLVVLYKFGGVWTDFDSLWVDSVDKVSPEDAWIPLSSGNLRGWDLINDNSFIEGGMMRFPAGNSFIERALQTFPEYTKDVATCWACVGPKHLTNTYISMQSEGAELPTTVPSATLFGGAGYRRNLPKMHSSIDLNVVQPNSVAFHLFTSTGEFHVQKSSLIDFLFRAAGVEVHSKGFTHHVSLGKLSQRRRLQDAEGSDVYTPERLAVRFDGVYDEVCGDDKQGFLDECTQKYAPVECVDCYSGSVIIEFMAASEDLDTLETTISNDGFQLDSMAEPLIFIEIVTEEPERPETDYVSQTDFDALAARVAALEESYYAVQEQATEVDAGLVEMSTCVANYRRMGDTDDADTDTETDTETDREDYMMLRDGTKCAMDDNRSFKLEFTTEENCAMRCREDGGCLFFSTNEYEDTAEKWCIGCDVEPTDVAADWYTFELTTVNRRRLTRSEMSELEQLRADNEALRELLRSL